MNRSHTRNSIVTFVLAALIIVSGNVITTKTVDASAPTYSSTTYTFNEEPFEEETALIHYVKVDLTDPDIELRPRGANSRSPVYLPDDPEPYWNNFKDNTQELIAMYNYYLMVGEVAAINTDYFCREDPDDGIEQCVGDAGAPQGLFVTFGTKYKWPGNRRASLTISYPSSDTGYTPTASINTYKGDITIPFWTIKHAVSGGPIILQEGIRECNPNGEEDIPPKKCNGTTSRSGACISSDGKTLWLMATKDEITWRPFASFMESLGCYDGMEFDGGGSAGLIYEGEYKVRPDSLIGTALIVTYNPPCTVLPCPTDTDS